MLLQDGSMPIHWASRSGAVEMMTFLIKMGSSPTSCIKGEVGRACIAYCTLAMILSSLQS